MDIPMDIHGKICGYGCGYGWEISYPRQAWIIHIVTTHRFNGHFPWWSVTVTNNRQADFLRAIVTTRYFSRQRVSGLCPDPLESTRGEERKEDWRRAWTPKIYERSLPQPASSGFSWPHTPPTINRHDSIPRGFEVNVFSAPHAHCRLTNSVKVQNAY